MNDIEQLLNSLPLKKVPTSLDDRIFTELSKVDIEKQELKTPSPSLDERIFSDLKKISNESNKKTTPKISAWVYYGISAVAALFILNFFSPTHTDQTIENNDLFVNSELTLMEESTPSSQFEGTPFLVNSNTSLQPVIQQKVIRQKWVDPDNNITIITSRPQNDVKFIPLPID